MPFQTTNGKLFYRVGDVIISTNSENPAKWYGGTWELFAPGRTLVCIDTSQTEFNSIKKTGGSKYMQSHNHSGSIASSGNHNHGGTAVTAGSHTHAFRMGTGNGSGTDYYGVAAENGNTRYWLRSFTPYQYHTNANQIAGDHTHSLSINSGGSHNHGLTINSNGSGNAQNLQPFIVVYMWIRTA